MDLWEEKIGFKSMRRKFNEDWEAAKDKSTLRRPIKNSVLASLVDPEGRLLIQNTLHCFRDGKQIIVLDKDYSKLTRALERMETDEELGIYVFDNVLSSNNILRSGCGNKRSCSNTKNSKRIEGDWELQFFASPRWTYFNNGQGYYQYWEYTVDYYCEMRSRKKNLFWWSKNHDDDIKWSTGYGVVSDLGTITHGTGWTQNSWKITYFKRLFPITTSPFNALPVVNYEFSYNNTHLENLDVAGLVCEDDCF